MLHKRFIFRQLTGSGKQSAVLILCIILSIITIVSLNGFSESIHLSLLKDSRTLHTADIIIHSHFPISDPLIDSVSAIENQDMVESTLVHEFYSSARTENENNSILASLKIVEPGYPFYGQVELASGRDFRKILSRGNIIVEQTLLDRLNLQIGARLRLGSSVLKIQDVVLKEPDRPVNFLSFGPRIFISSQDLESLELLQKGSRVSYNLLLKVRDEKNLDAIAAQLRNAAIEDQEQVETFRTARSRVKRFFDNFLFFLALIAIFTLILSGFGIHSSLTAFLREKEKTIAVMKTIGGTSSMITLNYIAVLSIFGFIGTLLGLILGFLLQYLMPLFFGDMLPEDMELIISWRAVLEGMNLGFIVVALFSFLPLYRLRDIRPASVFRKETLKAEKGIPFYTDCLMIFFFFTAMVLWQLNDIKTGFFFILGVTGLILLTTLAASLLLSALKGLRPRSLAMRQAVKGLFRPGNATRSVVVTLSTSLAVIFSIYLIEENLDAAFVHSFPADAPNLFFIDIQPDQVDDFSESISIQHELYPVIRSRIISINGEKIDRSVERRRRGDNLGRHFNLTYRDYLLDDEVIIKGKSLFREDMEGLQVSVLDTVVDMRSMNIGDKIEFKIQGIPLNATVSSIRTRTKESVKPYFYFVFPENSIIKDAPQTIFSAARIQKDKISEVQNKIVSQFPNISVIDVTRTIAVFSNIMHRLSLVIHFFTVFSIIAGILIIISSILATRFARIQEAVYFKILGAKSRFILTVFSLENAITGFMSAFIALIISQTGSFIICMQIFDISYKSYMGASFLMILGTITLVVLTGFFASLSVIKHKPVIFLREQAEG